MKILVDEMPIFKDDCLFADTCWENAKWKNYCQLGADGISECDIENGECSFLREAPSVVPTDDLFLVNSTDEEIQTQIIEFPDSHQKFVFERKIEMDGDSMKICDWNYKGEKMKGADDE